MSMITSYNPTYGVMCIRNVNLEQTKYKEECLQIIESMDFGDISTITYLPDRKYKQINMYNIYVKYSNLNENNEVLISYFNKMKESNEAKIKPKFKLSINHDFKFNNETKKYWIATFKNRNTFNVGSKIWDSLIGY
jgi:hypothetical protein